MPHAALEKRVNEAASSHIKNTAKQTVITYLGGFIYENNRLQYIIHEEGRIRLKSSADSSNPPNADYIYDYFLKDHVGNVRMVLTEEKQTDNIQC